MSEQHELLERELPNFRSALPEVKDEDGLFTDDPKKNPDATHIPRISAQELIERDLNDLVLERIVIEYLGRSKWVKELQIVNGLKPGQVTAALEGEDVGTIIYHA